MKTPSKKEILAVYRNAYEIGDSNLMKALESLYGNEIFREDTINRIKTFRDAYNMLGLRHPLVMSYIECSSPHQEHWDDISLRAFLQLRVITAALNDNWTPQFSDSEVRHSPKFWLLTQDDANSLNGEYKHTILAVVCKDYVCFCPALSERFATISTNFFFKTKELADYCANQFIELWADFFGIQRL